MPDSLPSLDDILGTDPKAQRPTTEAESTDIAMRAGTPIAPPVVRPTPTPSLDDILGPAPKPQAPPSPELQEFDKSGAGLWGVQPPGANAVIAQTPVGRILDAVGQGARQGWGTDKIGLSDESVEALKKIGIFNDASKGQQSILRTFNEAVFRPLAAAADIANRTFGAVQGAAEGGIAQAGAETGTETGRLLGRDIAGAIESFGGLAGSPGALHGEPHTIETQKSLGAIGGDEGAYFGTEKPKPTDDPVIQSDITRPTQPQAAVAATEEAATATTVEQDIHAAARQIAPEVFSGPKGYDALQSQKQTFQRWIQELADTRDRAATEDIDAKIADTQNRLQDATGKRAATYRNRLADLQDQRAQAVEGAIGDTPDMQRVRQALMQTDYALRDLAPQVSDAYRRAQEQMPVPEKPVIAETVVPPLEAPGEKPPEQEAPFVKAAEEAPPKALTTPEGLPRVVPAEALNIANDVSQKLLKAGRPQEEAEAAGHLIASHYEARAARFRGAKGSASDLYRAEAPTIRAGRGALAGREMEFAQGEAPRTEGALIHAPEASPEEMAARQRQQQKTEAEARMLGRKGTAKPQQPLKGEPGFEDQGDMFGGGAGKPTQGTLFQAARGKVTFAGSQRIITLFKNADSSTFIHETGHVWLEEMMRDAVDDHAPPDLRQDAAAVRQWLGAGPESPITRAQHEKFARGFERYMMEGRAPSKALADVFAKFKQWLTQIYETVTKLRAPINDDIRDVFDRLVTKSPEKTVIAEDRTSSDLADRHEALESEAKPGTERAVANVIEAESAAEAGRRIPEKHDAIDRSVEGGVGEGSTESAPPHGGEPQGRPDASGAPSSEAVGEVGAGRGAAPAKSAGGGGKFIHERVPREPQRLLGFLRSLGGLKDEGGELSGIAGKKGSFGGLINNKSGMSLDDAALRAQEEGYFGPPPPAGYLGERERTAINELLDALSDDIAGKPRYSEKDMDRVAAYEGAIQRNDELNHLAEVYGLNINEMGRQEFFAALYDKMSQDEAAKVVDEQGDHAEAVFAEFERRAQEESDAHGEAWEPEPGSATIPRSLEDLENERQSEASARDTTEGAGRDGQSRPVARDTGVGEESGGSRDGGAGAGRGNPEAGEPSGPPPGRVEPRAAEPGTQLKDLAGNIRLENLNFENEEDARAIVRQVALANQDFRDARFGDPAYQLQRQIRAAGALLEKTADSASDAFEKWKTSGSEADAEAFELAKQRVLLAANVRAELAAGTGRGLAAFKALKRRGPTEDMVSYIKRTEGKTLFQLQEEGDLFNQLETPEQKAKFLNETMAGKWQKTRSMILSYFINNLISGPLTHGAYSVGNTTYALFKATADIGATAAIDAVREYINGAPLESRVQFSEVPAALYGLWRGWRDSLPASWQAVKTGIPFMKGYEELVSRGLAEALPIKEQPLTEAFGKAGYALETPGRSVTAIHTMFYAANYEAEIARRAVRSAIKDGLTGDEYNTRVAEFIARPPDIDVQEAHDEALKMVLMKRPPYDSFMANINRAVNNNLAAKIVMPFMQIGGNILREGIVEHSPIGLIASKQVRENLSGMHGDIARSTQYAKIAVGTTAAVATMSLAMEGMITGGGPSDTNQRRLKEQTGWLPYSIKVGDTYIPYRKFLGPLGPLIAGAADMYEIGHAANQGEYAEAASSLLFGFSEVIADETWMSGLSNFINAAKNFDRDGGKYLRGVATDFIPFSVGLGQIAKLVDPYARRVNSLTDAVKAKIPGVSETLLPLRDMWGNPLASRNMLSPSVENNDPATMALEQLKFAPARPAGFINGVKLSPQQYDDYSRISGVMAHARITALVRTPGFQAYMQTNSGQATKAISDIIKDSRKAARLQVQMKSMAEDGADNIAALAARAKLAKITGTGMTAP